MKDSEIVNGTVFLGNSNTATWFVIDKLISIKFYNEQRWETFNVVDTCYSYWEDYRSSWHWIPPQLF